MSLSHREPGLRRRALAVSLVLAVGVAVFGSIAPASAATSARHDYIVVLKGSARSSSVAADHASRYHAQVRYVYSHALQGYAASIPDSEIARLRTDATVAYVEADQVFHADSVDTTQKRPPSWGLDRIDQTNLPLDRKYHYRRTGAGVTAYIIDTGIFFGHSDFGGRAVSGFDAIDGGTADDCHGHGTHVAGTVGGTTYGVAKGVNLVAVRVLNCSGSGTTAQVVAGIDWVSGDHDAGEKAVANMSLGGGASTALDTAVGNSIADGVPYAIAAGNGDIFGNPLDACTVSPARVAAAMTIGASDKKDKAASFSNFGTCIDWFAPGVNITSAWLGSPTATNTISGTSMATPHTTGVAALYVQLHPADTPAQVAAALAALTTKDIITGTPSTPNNDLLFTNF